MHNPVFVQFLEIINSILFILKCFHLFIFFLNQNKGCAFVLTFLSTPVSQNKCCILHILKEPDLQK